MKRKGMAATLALVMGISLMGAVCTAQAEDADKIVVGVSFQNLSNEWIAMLQDAIVDKAEADYGDEMELILLDGEGDASKQITQLESFINQGVDVVMCNPQDGNMLIPAFQEVIDAGIPIIALGSDCEVISMVQHPA